MLSGSCKLVWIIFPGIKRPISARQTVDPAEKAHYEPSHLDLHYLCGSEFEIRGSKNCEKYIQGLKMMDEIAEVST